MNESKFNGADDVSEVAVNDGRIIYLKGLVIEKNARIAELEAKAEALEAQVAQQASQIEALTPKPVVVSRWCNVYPDEFCFDSQLKADRASDNERVACIRRDTFKYPDGRVEYKLEVEKT